MPRLLKQWRSIELFHCGSIELYPVQHDRRTAALPVFCGSPRGSERGDLVKLGVGRFTEVYHDERMTAALPDRLTFKSTVTVMEGDSYRLKESCAGRLLGDLGIRGGRGFIHIMLIYSSLDKHTSAAARFHSIGLSRSAQAAQAWSFVLNSIAFAFCKVAWSAHS